MTTEYSTISVPKEVKKRLEKAKGNKEWGEFLGELYDEAQFRKSKRAFEELANTVTEDDLKAIEASSKDFREKFAFR